MENFGGPELQKYAGIDRRGRDRLKQNSVEPFTGFPEAVKNRFGVASEFTPESVVILTERILNTLEVIEQDLNIKFMLAGRDYPLHSTVMEGLYEGEDEDKREKIFLELQEKLDVELVGSEVQFDYVLLDGGNLLLVAKNIPEPILEARELLSQEYSNANLKPLGMQHMLHSSLARINELPDGFDVEEYKRRIIDLRHSISADPLILKIGHIAKGQSYQYLTESQQYQ